jgi:hypothetical protein
VKPNATTNQLTATASLEVNKLTKKNILVCWGWINDISRNNDRNGLNQELKYLRNINLLAV